MHTRPRHTAALSVLVAVAALTHLTACSGQSRAVGPARPFPESAVPGEVLDVQVFRKTTRVTMTNTTPRSFGPSTIWLNRRFSLPIESFAVGETLLLDLTHFRDQFSDAFRAGGFFATRNPYELVLAQLETMDPETGEPRMLGLVVVSNEAE